MAGLPEMTREEAAEFWETHSSAEYWDDLEDVDLRVHPSIKSPRDLSRRCPKCDRRLLFRYVDRDSQDGQVTVHLLEFYCPEGHFRQLATESAKLMRAIDAVLDLRGGRVAAQPVARTGCRETGTGTSLGREHGNDTM